MKLIKPSYLILDQKPGLEGIYEQIELAGRTCYKSTRPEGQTAKNFVDRMIASKHYAMLEHGTVYLKLPYIWNMPNPAHPDVKLLTNVIKKYIDNPYSMVCESKDYAYITTNYRVIVENDWLHDLQYLCEPTEHHEKRVTVRFTTDRGVSHELVRHRVFSFAMESTRYCNYFKDKFGSEITFIIPSWMKDAPEGKIEWEGKDPMLVKGDERFLYLNQMEEARGVYDTLLALSECEYRYMYLVSNNLLTPQEARQVLPNALKTELVMTGFIFDWEHLFKLRTSYIAETGKPHPDMSNLCDPLYEEFINKNMIKV